MNIINVFIVIIYESDFPFFVFYELLNNDVSLFFAHVLNYFTQCVTIL